jgi:hypothetical protein
MTLRQDISWVTIAGLVFVLAGSIVIAVAVFVNPRGAIRIAGQSGASYWGAGKKPIPEETYLQQPAVRNLIRQSKMAKWGLGLIALGTVFQIIGALFDV